MLKGESTMLELENELTDQGAISLIADLAKTDNEAFKLLVNLQNSKEYGESDMLLGKIHRYLKDRE